MLWISRRLAVSNSISLLRPIWRFVPLVACVKHLRCRSAELRAGNQRFAGDIGAQSRISGRSKVLMSMRV